MFHPTDSRLSSTVAWPNFLKSFVYTLFIHCMHACIYVFTHMHPETCHGTCVQVIGQTVGQFSPPIMWVPEMEIRLSSLEAGAPPSEPSSSNFFSSLSVCLSVCLAVYHLSIYDPVYLSSMILAVWLFVCLIIHPYTYTSSIFPTYIPRCVYIEHIQSSFTVYYSTTTLRYQNLTEDA